jgi:diacylglycerol kinase family enzyme
VRPDSQLVGIVQDAIKAGIKLIAVARGDGTIDSVIGAMVKSGATLGIIPTGTRNNLAFNLGIAGDIATSVAILRQGRKLKIDAGRVHCGRTRFLTLLFIHHFQLGTGVSVVLYLIASLVGFTRIYVGAHYPRDVIAGIVLGSIWVILVTLLESASR